jgi:hypothetical protein
VWMPLIYMHRGLLIEVGITQDYVKVSHVDYLPMLKGIEITDKKVNDTSTLVQEFISGVHHDEFAPFVNIEMKLCPTWDSPLDPRSERRQIIEIKLIVKADKGYIYAIFRRDKPHNKTSSCYSTPRIISKVRKSKL